MRPSMTAASTIPRGVEQQEITPAEWVRGEAIRVAVLGLLSPATARVAMPMPSKNQCHGGGGCGSRELRPVVYLTRLLLDSYRFSCLSVLVAGSDLI